MKNMILILMATAMALVFAGNCYADPDSFAKADRNNDGTISQKEFDAAVKKKFREYDKNRDGRITLEEFTEKNPDDVKEFRYMDRNNDGFVTSDEFYKAALRRREEIDFDRDKKIGKQEATSNKGVPFLRIYF